MASDKVIIYFAKHNNIGPFVVAKDISKNIEKIVFTLNKASHSKKKEVFETKKPYILRFLSILNLLINQFSIVLCYQPDFFDKMIENLADMMSLSSHDQSVLGLSK